MEHIETSHLTQGVKQRIFRGGTGEPVLFLHGGAGLSVWTPFFDALATHHELIVPEHPGFGQSDDPAWLKSVSDLAYFYLDFIESVPLERFHLVANSIGGWIAAELAVRNCSRLQSLTLIAPGGVLPDGAPYEDSFAWTPEQSVRKLFHNQAIADRMLANPPSDAQRAISAKNKATVAKLGQSARLHNPDLPKWLHRIRTRTLIVWGDDDQLAPASTGDAWIADLPDATLRVIAESGHLPHAEQAGVVAPIVLDFIARR